MEATSSKSRYWQGHRPSKGLRGEAVPAPSSLGEAVSIPWRVAALFQPLPPSSLGLLLVCPYVFPFLSLIQALVLGSRPTQIVWDELISGSFITSAKTLFSNKVTFTGLGIQT